MPKPKPWIDQLRNAVEASGLTLYQISKETGIPKSRLHDFAVSGKTLSVSNFETLAKHLGFKLVRSPKP